MYYGMQQSGSNILIVICLGKSAKAFGTAA